MARIVLLFVSLLMIAGISPALAADLTVPQLKNSRYLIPAWENPEEGEWVRVENGEFSRRDPENPLFVTVVKTALGQLSQDQPKAAAVIYAYNTGGSGIFTMLCAVINDQGQPKQIAAADLGDRVIINALSIRSGKIIIDMVVHGPHDPACCPTVKKIATYALVGNKLVEE